MAITEAISPRYDIIVLGDELESIITALSAAKLGVSVALVRRSGGLLGGLSTRGGLSYMDITPEYIPPLMRDFFERVSFIRVALDSGKSHAVLYDMLLAANVDVYHSVTADLCCDPEQQPVEAKLSDGRILEAKVFIDATPDADYARQLGVPFIKGLGGVLGENQNFLGISPVFRIAGVDVEELRAFETSLREDPEMPMILNAALPDHPEKLRQEYLTRPTFVADDPEQRDYLDILNPVIGIAFHLWRHGLTAKEAASYHTAPIAVDGGNISILPNGSLGFNGLVKSISGSDEEVFDQLLAYSHGAPCPKDLEDAMNDFGRYLREVGGFKNAKIIPPDELYVRQTVTLLSRQNMTADHMIAGGVEAEKAIGTSSYWLDLRGAKLWHKFPGEDLPKPVFNVGLDVALPLLTEKGIALQNFAFVGRAAGYSPIGQGAGRIVQHNCLVGEGLGIAAALAVLSDSALPDVCEYNLDQIREILDIRNRKPMPIDGFSMWDQIRRSESVLLNADTAVVTSLRQACTESLSVLG